MYLIFYCSICLCRIILINQSFYYTEVITDEDMAIPSYCFIKEYPTIRHTSELSNFDSVLNNKSINNSKSHTMYNVIYTKLCNFIKPICRLIANQVKSQNNLSIATENAFIEDDSYESHSENTILSQSTKTFILFKPIRKIYEYEYNSEKGIKLKDNVFDSIANPDYSSQAINIALGGVLLSMLFNLFG